MFHANVMITYKSYILVSVFTKGKVEELNKYTHSAFLYTYRFQKKLSIIFKKNGIQNGMINKLWTFQTQSQTTVYVHKYQWIYHH